MDTESRVVFLSTITFVFLELSHAECVLLLCVLMYIIHSGNKIVKL